MAERGQTSSMTSVTEENSSADSESDTTESSCSAVTSSLLSSSDYNTDDKLTPGLVSISISKTGTNDMGGSRDDHWYGQRNSSEHGASKMVDGSGVATHRRTTNSKDKREAGAQSQTVPLFPYGSNPLPLEDSEVGETHSCPRKLRSLRDFERCEENLGVSDSENKLSTDFSDTSSICQERTVIHNSSVQVASDSTGTNGNEDTDDVMQQSAYRPFLPDWASTNWYQARCFDHYWRNYNMVADWYRLHLSTVHKLCGQQGGAASAGACDFGHSKRRQGSSRSRKARRIRLARIRQLSKERRRAAAKEKAAASAENSSCTESASPAELGDEGMEMEITDEMVQFFATSIKHKMERESKKKSMEGGEDEADHLNIEQVVSGQQARSTSAPVEQPGVRRSAELRHLYGPDAPMIQGMETALQLTFDRVTDKCQPKLWPNMPLKINFA